MTSALCKKIYKYFDFNFRYSEPLVKALLQREFRFKLPNLGQWYDDMSDLSIHVADYHAARKLQSTTNKIFYRAFSTTLKKGMRIWYNGLSLGCIHSFC